MTAAENTRSTVAAAGGVALLTAAILAPRLILPGRIPVGQPQWSLRADYFWDALTSGDLVGTFLAPHPGLTIMWVCGAAQRLAGATTTMEKTIAASVTVALVATVLILLAVKLVARLLRDESHPASLAAAAAVGLFLAFDPLLILMTGLVGLDGTLSLTVLVAFLLLCRHLETGSPGSLLAASAATGLAVATKAPALLLLPLPLLLWPTRPADHPAGRLGCLRVVGALALGSAAAMVLLLPSFWVDPLATARGLILGAPGEDSLHSVMLWSHDQFFLGRTTRSPGWLYYPVQLLFRLTPLALLGALSGWISPRFRSSRLVWRTALFFALFLLGMTVVGKKSWRYVMPAMVLVDLLGAIGLCALGRDLASRVRRPALAGLSWVLLVGQSLWVVSGAPYYELRLNPLAGGPTAAAKAIQLGWGAGLEQVQFFLESEAERLGRTVKCSGGYGKGLLRKGIEFESSRVRWLPERRRRSAADCHVDYLPNIQREGARRRVKGWKDGGVRAFTVSAGGLELARVLCDPAKGFRTEGDPLTAKPLESVSRSGFLPHAILLLTLDTTRADRLGTYSGQESVTPNLDELAREGVRFDRAISPMPTTDPSHLSMLTGLYPRTHGSRRNGIRLADPSRDNLARWTRNLGFRTAAFISRRHLVPSALDLKGFQHEDGPEGHSRDGAVTVERALAWVEENGAEPFFVWVHLFEPHQPYEPPPPYNRLSSSRPGSHQGVNRQIELYQGEVAYMDSLIGTLLKGIRGASQSSDPPLVMVVGDHGEAMDELLERFGFAFDHGRYLYQGIVHVPLLLHWHGRLPASTVVRNPVELIGLPATLAELLGEDGFETQGSSLVTRIESAAAGTREALGERPLAFSELRQGTRRDVQEYAVQDGRHKLILTRPGDHLQLYDISNDPTESTNLADALPRVRDQLLSDLLAWLEATPAAADASANVPEEKREALRALGYVE